MVIHAPPGYDEPLVSTRQPILASSVARGASLFGRRGNNHGRDCPQSPPSFNRAPEACQEKYWPRVATIWKNEQIASRLFQDDSVEDAIGI